MKRFKRTMNHESERYWSIVIGMKHVVQSDQVGDGAEAGEEGELSLEASMASDITMGKHIPAIGA